MPNGASSAARSAPMLAAPHTAMPRSSATRISLCHTAAMCSNAPSMIAIRAMPRRRRASASTSPTATGGSTRAPGSRAATSAAGSVGPTNTTVGRGARHPIASRSVARPGHDHLDHRDAERRVRQVDRDHLALGRDQLLDRVAERARGPRRGRSSNPTGSSHGAENRRHSAASSAGSVARA